jgi:periplasmic protein TonB
MFAPLPRRRLPGSTWLSVGVHAAAAGVLLLASRVHPVRVFSLPGTAAGTHVELAYLPGRAPSPTMVHSPARSKPIPPAAHPSTPQITAPAASPSPSVSSAPAVAPDSSQGSDSWGSGSVEIALTTYSPSPAPDLSVLPHGVQGDVVVDVTIDPNGKVADLAVLHTLGYGIESSVIGTLKTWTFRPATKDGTPIASVQELHFHYGPV